MPVNDFSTLFDFLPIGAYRSLPDGTQLRANAALVRLNGYTSEAEMLPAVRDIAREWYVDPTRRAAFSRLLETEGHVLAFVSEIYRHRTRERIWISENAHLVRDAGGCVLFYEGTVEEITERVRTAKALADSEARLRQITADVPGAVMQAEIDVEAVRRYVFVSEGVRALAGVEPEAVMADPAQLDGLISKQDHDRLQHERAAADAADRAFHSEFTLNHPDGSPRWVELHASMPTGHGALQLRTAVMVDITARKQAEAALRDSEQRWKLALEASGDGVWDWDLLSGQEVFSCRFMQMYGYPAEQTVMSAEEFDGRTHADDLAAMLQARQAHLEGRTPSYVNEHRVRCIDGSWKWTLSRGLVIARVAGGRPLRMIGTHTDLSERRAAEALRIERDRAAAADQAKTELLSRVSHELRTPLNAVLGFAQLLDTDPTLPLRHRAWVQQLLDSGRHLLGVVDDVLDLSSAQSGGFRLELQAVDLGGTLAASWAMLAGEARRAHVEFVDGLAGQPPLQVHADPQRLRQVLSNLLSNAIKYNRPDGRVQVQARQQAGEQGTKVVLQVADSGRGMDEAQLARAFTPFERLGAQRSGIQGTGLGLALARQLMLAMGGTLTVASTRDVGSTFTLTLPAAHDPGHPTAG